MLTEVEDHLVAETKALFGQKLKVVDSLPGDWDADMLKRIIISAPAVYLAFTGGPRIKENNTTVGIESRWSFFAVTGHISGTAARRRGDSVQIGAYEIISRILPHFDRHTVPDVGTMELERVENLYNGTIESRGVSIYTALFSLQVYFDDIPDLSALADFEEFQGDFRLGDGPGAVDAEIDITLPPA